MRRCWSHDPEQRPRFDEIVEQIPDMMPQLLVAAVDCQMEETGRLRFRKGETIILLDKWWALKKLNYRKTRVWDT